MSTSVPAIRARMGNTSYFILSMKAGVLAGRVSFPENLWDKGSLEEIYQRELDYDRIKEQIAPYLATNESRFFGSVIVAAHDFDEVRNFQSLSELESLSGFGKLGAYRSAFREMGILELNGETLIALDGQHRLKGILYAKDGKDHWGKNLENFRQNEDVGNDDLCVILIPYRHQSRQKARAIFTRVNRYARSISTAAKIIMDDDDVIAHLTRRICQTIIPTRLVNIKQNIAVDSSYYFTALNTVYRSTKFIIENDHGRVDTTKLPDTDIIKMYEKDAFSFWEAILADIEVFETMLQNKEKSGDAMRIEIRKNNLLGRPIAQYVLVRVYLRLIRDGFSHDEACSALNSIPWNINVKNKWQKVFLTAKGTMNTRLASLAIRLLSYMAGEETSETAKKQLLLDFRAHHPEEERGAVKLPKRVCD